jgi:hypothetical protein
MYVRPGDVGHSSSSSSCPYSDRICCCCEELLLLLLLLLLLCSVFCIVLFVSKVQMVLSRVRRRRPLFFKSDQGINHQERERESQEEKHKREIRGRTDGLVVVVALFDSNSNSPARQQRP